MPTEVRIKRIADRIRQDLAEMLITNRIHDPRVSGANITDVNVDRELAYADIYISAVEGRVREKEIMAGLAHASGFIRHELSNQIELRVFPRLRFHWDMTPERADHIEQLIKQLHEESKKKNARRNRS
jgi:ribosome-binding factor A